MRTDELALDYIERAELTLEEARNAFEKEVYSLAIRRAQEICELSLKGALRKEKKPETDNSINHANNQSGTWNSRKNTIITLLKKNGWIHGRIPCTILTGTPQNPSS